MERRRLIVRRHSLCECLIVSRANPDPLAWDDRAFVRRVSPGLRLRQRDRRFAAPFRWASRSAYRRRRLGFRAEHPANLFCFLADVEIRKQTQNQKGLQDALRGILDAGGDMRYDWPIEKALQTGDRAAGVEVLLKLYEQMRDRPMQVDLDSLWKQLGVRIENGAAQFDNDAPLAKIREAITARKPRS